MPEQGYVCCLASAAWPPRADRRYGQVSLVLPSAKLPSPDTTASCLLTAPFAGVRELLDVLPRRRAVSQPHVPHPVLEAWAIPGPSPPVQRSAPRWAEPQHRGASKAEC